MDDAGAYGTEAATERIATVLHAERGAVLRETYGDEKWAGVPDHTRVDVVANAIDDLVERAIYRPDYFTNDEHVRAALRVAVKLRRDNLHRRGRSRKVVPLHDDFEPVDHSAAGSDQDEIADALRHRELLPYARDCLAELTETQEQILRLKAQEAADGTPLGDRRIAKILGLSGRPEVQRELRYAMKTIAQFAVVLEAGRLCGKRAVSIESYLAGNASPDDVRRAEAHLDTCPACNHAYQHTRERLGREVAALIPLPVLALAGAGPVAKFGGLFSGRGWGRLDSLRDAIFGVFSRQPAGAELAAGSAASASAGGVAIGTKVVVGACLLAGGAGVCDRVVIPNVNYKPVKTQRTQAEEPRRARAAVLAPAFAAALAAPRPAPTARQTTAPSARTTTSRPRRVAHTATTPTAQAALAPAPDLHPGATGGGFEATAPQSSSSTAHAARRSSSTPAGGGFENGDGPAAIPPTPSTQAKGAPARDFNSTGFESGTP